MRRLSLVTLLAPTLALGQYPRTTVELRGSMDALSGGRDHWQEHTVSVGARATARTGFGVSAGWLERFAQVDRRVLVDGSFALGRRVTLGADAEWSPSHAVVARTGGGVRGHLGLGKGWGIEGRAAQRAYAANTVRLFGGSLERYWGTWHATYTGSVSLLDDAPRAVSHSARGSRLWGDRGIVTLGVSSGREVEALGAGVVLPMTVRSAGAWGAMPLGGSVDLTFATSVTRQGDVFTRTHTALGLRVVRETHRRGGRD